MSPQIVWNVAANISYNQTKKKSWSSPSFHRLLWGKAERRDREVVGGKQVSVRMSAARFAFTSN